MELDFLAPFNPVGPNPGHDRLQRFVNIDQINGTITPLAIGTNLVQVRVGIFYQIFRIQVHDRILGWWFGNTSMTVPTDSVIFHSQPSLYALFSDDLSGTDLVGDITGHGYVPLTSDNQSRFVVNADGRLRGVSEGDGTVSGTFLGVTHSIPVKVIDYGKQRKKLEYVQMPDVEHPQEMHNVLFMSEGFRDSSEDKETFNKIVAEVVDEMFDKPRHAPYNLLEGRFNIWKVYEPSVQHGATCGFRVNDEEMASVGKGYPIPFIYELPNTKGMYTLDLLVRRVGLPSRNENRTTQQLKDLWSTQSLTDFDRNKVNDDLVTAWKRQKSVGILEARDTFLGLMLGRRYPDRTSGNITEDIQQPATDEPATMAPFIRRMYEWFQIEASRTLTPDPRRHPPELQSVGETNAGSSILRYISGLRVPFNTPQVSQEWLPDTTETLLKRSRGLIAIIANENLTGGTNFSNGTMTANSRGNDRAVLFAYINQGNERVMKRNLPPSIKQDTDKIIDTIAHEFGHSFNLGDEYEQFPGDDPNANQGKDVDLDDDNLSRYAGIYEDFMVDRRVNPSKVKWFGLARFQLSDTLIKDSEVVGTKIRITIDKRFIGKWVAASKKGQKASLRRIAFTSTTNPDGRQLPPTFTPTGRQLPLVIDRDHFLSGLVIEEVKEADSTILLTSNFMPPPMPVFPAGSIVFVPRLVSATQVDLVVEKEVVVDLNVKKLPLNTNTDVIQVNQQEDEPRDISGFKPPCKEYKVIGIYEGAQYHSGMLYRPAGMCKMRASTDDATGEGEFCFVCKYLILNRVNPALHDVLDKLYYPNARR